MCKLPMKEVGVKVKGRNGSSVASNRNRNSNRK